MTNIYWPVYKNLEVEVERLSFDIHIDDKQLNVYSTKISDLILRASAEIESISKELYSLNGGTKEGEIKYDDVALKYLNQKWILKEKKVLISSINCFQSNRVLQPFLKNEKRTNGTKLTYSWNNSYQNLKHSRAKSIEFGSIKYLFDSLAALFLLNIYYKNEGYKIDENNKIDNFPLNQGSSLFSIKLHKYSSYDSNFVYRKKEDFNECTFYSKLTDASVSNLREANEIIRKKQIEIFAKHPKLKSYLENNDIKKYEGKNLMRDILESNEYTNILRQSVQAIPKELNKTETEIVLNKNCILQRTELKK